MRSNEEKWKEQNGMSVQRLQSLFSVFPVYFFLISFPNSRFYTVENHRLVLTCLNCFICKKKKKKKKKKPSRVHQAVTGLLVTNFICNMCI